MLPKLSREDAISKLCADGYLWDIGQIDDKAIRWLKRQPNVTRERAMWPWVTYGTCEKTLYRLKEVPRATA
jgi:hypothetical protein